MNNDLILLGHGSGGRLSHQLLDELIIPIVSGIPSAGQNDAALLDNFPGRIAYTTDSFVVDPIFFPGGTIGSLAVHGTVNDLAMMGARPVWLSVGLIIEEGFSKADLRTILEDMRSAADTAGVAIVTGDTKVVPRGKADKLFITTSGVGAVEHTLQIHGANAQPGDVIIINGTTTSILRASWPCFLRPSQGPTWACLSWRPGRKEEGKRQVWLCLGLL